MLTSQIDGTKKTTLADSNIEKILSKMNDPLRTIMFFYYVIFAKGTSEALAKAETEDEKMKVFARHFASPGVYAFWFVIGLIPVGIIVAIRG